MFRHLTSSLDIRAKDRGRDRELYAEIRQRLGMGQTRPKTFFSANPRTPQEVLETFLDVFRPFVEMVTQIYDFLAAYHQQATGGNDFRLRYDSAQSSLRFDLTAFQAFE